MAGKFECYRDKAGKFRFRLKAANHQVVLSSEAYSSKASCTNGIKSVQKNCTDKKCFDKKKTASGKFRFNLKATNGEVIGTSQNYKSDSGCRNGISIIARAAKGAKVVDV